MKNRMTSVSLCSLLTLLLISPAAARSQSAPAAPSPTAASAQDARLAPSFKPDARLIQRVSLHVEGQAVSEVLALLSAKTGVSFSAQRSIGEEKVIAFIPARPLISTLHDLAALFNNIWLQYENAKGEICYLLVRTAQAKAYEDRLAAGPERRFMAQMDLMVQALQESQAPLAQRPGDDVIRACLENPERRLATQFYSLLSPQQQQQLFEEGRTDDFPFKNLSVEQQQVLSAWREALQTQAQSPPPAGQAPDRQALSGISPQLTQAQLEQASLRFDIGGPAQSGGSAVVRLMVGEGGLMLRTLHDSGSAQLPRHGDPYTLQPIGRKASLPEEATVRNARGGAVWVDQLQALAEATHRPVLSDYFRSFECLAGDRRKWDQSDDEPTGRDRIAELDRFSRHDRRLWWGRGSTLLFRLRNWATQREYELSDAWVDEMVRRLHSHPDAVLFGDLYRLLDLSHKQLIGLLRLRGDDVERYQGPFGVNINKLRLGLLLVRECYPDPESAIPLVRHLAPPPKYLQVARTFEELQQWFEEQRKLLPKYPDWTPVAQAMYQRLLDRDLSAFVVDPAKIALSVTWEPILRLNFKPDAKDVSYSPQINARIEEVKRLSQQIEAAKTDEERDRLSRRSVMLQAHNHSDVIKLFQKGDKSRKNYIDPGILEVGMVIADDRMVAYAPDGHIVKDTAASDPALKRPPLPRTDREFILPTLVPDDRRSRTVIRVVASKPFQPRQ